MWIYEIWYEQLKESGKLSVNRIPVILDFKSRHLTNLNTMKRKTLSKLTLPPDKMERSHLFAFIGIWSIQFIPPKCSFTTLIIPRVKTSPWREKVWINMLKKNSSKAVSIWRWNCSLPTKKVGINFERSRITTPIRLHSWPPLSLFGPLTQTCARGGKTPPRRNTEIPHSSHFKLLCHMLSLNTLISKVQGLIFKSDLFLLSPWMCRLCPISRCNYRIMNNTTSHRGEMNIWSVQD